MTNDLEQFGTEVEAEISACRERLQGEISRIEKRLAEAQESVRTASEHGDRSENAEWLTAMENVKLLTAQLSSLSAKSEVYASDFLGYKIRGTSVCVGSVLRIQNTADGETYMIKIVPQGVGNAEIGAISENSPVGAALLGRKTGDSVKVKAPGGNYIYKILEAI